MRLDSYEPVSSSHEDDRRAIPDGGSAPTNFSSQRVCVAPHETTVLPLVSVIVPVFNKAQYLAASLDSILEQTLANIEIVCIDDASTDGSWDILTRYAAIDHRVKVFRLGRNRGAGPSRNLGITVAISPFVQFTDADDLLPQRALELMHGRATEDKVPIVRGSITGFESDRPDRLHVLSTVPDKSSFVPLDEKSLWIPWWHPCYLFSRHLLTERAIGYPNLRDGEDPVFLASVLVKADRMSTVAEVTYRYRMTGIEDKERVNFRALEDYVHHARMVRDIFLAHRPECWTAGYGPMVERDIEDTFHRCSLYDEERRELRCLAGELFTAPLTKTMRVLFIYGHCGLGGVETSILNKLAALRRKNVDAEAMFLQYWGEGGVFVSQYAGVHLKADRKEQQEVLMRGWDVIIIVDTPEFLSVAIEAGVCYPVILETHASYVPALGHLHNKVSDPHVEAIVAPSDFNKDLLLLAGCPPSKIHIIANAIDPDVFRISEPDGDSPLAKLPGGVPLVICVGRIEPQKNTEQFVQIGLSLLERGQPAHFVVVGDAVDSADYAARVRDSIPKRLSKHFSFVPRLRYNQMPTLYKLAAESGGCLVIPSRNESQPMSILEAMISECPVVAASVGGVREMVVDGVTGFLFSQGETEDAISAVSRLLQDKHERSQLSSRALLLTKLDHSSSRAADLYMALINKVTRQTSQIPMDAAGDHSESVELLASSVARGKLAARLDSLIGEFVSLHMDILKVRPDASLSEGIIRSLLSGIPPSTEHRINPYSDIVPGAQVGCEPTANVSLAVYPKQDFSRSPDGCLNTLSLRFSGPSRWFTLELEVGWEEFRFATRYQLGMYLQPDRDLDGKVVLRLPLKAGGTVDHRFSTFRLRTVERSHHRSEPLVMSNLEETDPKGRPKLIFFFDSSADLALRIDYLTLYFA